MNPLPSAISSPVSLESLNLTRPSILSCPDCQVTMDVSDFSPGLTVECPACEVKIIVPGILLSHYSLLEEIGRGAIGAVFRAYDLQLEREVAIKILPPETEENHGQMQAIRREARAAARINHPHVMQVYAVGVEGDIPYLVMEYLPGPLVADYLEDQQAMPEDKALTVGIQIGKGLDASHKAEVVHGDVKPANMMYSCHGLAKLVDFGQAVSISSLERSSQWGTPYYVAPECIRGEAPSALSDQYSLGASLFRMITGTFAFNGDGPGDVLKASVRDPLPFAQDVNPAVSLKTSSVLRRMMQREPARRFPDMEAAVTQLEDAHRGALLIEKFNRTAAETRPASAAG